MGSFLDAGAIDEVHIFVAPMLMGGLGAKTAVAGLGAERLADCLRLAEITTEMIGEDIYVHGWRERSAGLGVPHPAACNYGWSNQAAG